MPARDARIRLSVFSPAYMDAGAAPCIYSSCLLLGCCSNTFAMLETAVTKVGHQELPTGHDCMVTMSAELGELLLEVAQ